MHVNDTAPGGALPRIVLLPGSLRRESWNLRLAHDLAARLAGRAQTDLVEPRTVGLPLLDEDLEADPAIAARARALHERIARAHALVVVTPDYNGQLPAYLKNLVDWVSRLPHLDPSVATAFAGRPALLCAASTGWGGGAAVVASARTLMGYVGAVVLGETVLVPRVQDAWAGEGFDFDPFFDDAVDAALGRLLAFARVAATSAPLAAWPAREVAA